MKSAGSYSNSTAAKRKAMPRLQEMPLTEEADAITDSDKAEAIKMHQAALEKLQQLQASMVHSGSAADVQARTSKKEIKEKMRRRREAAEAKKRKLRKAMEDGDDEGMIQELFSIQMVEVEERDRKLTKIKDKYVEKVNEIRDLTEEFQTEREDYLESIREQSQEAKLLQQILEQVQPLLRRDSNYYNLDQIKRDCKWSPETASWLLPPVMVTKTRLPAPADIPAPQTPGIQPSYMDIPDDLRIRAKLSQTSTNSDYFNSSRAQRLLQENKMLRNGVGPGHGALGRHFLEDNDLLGRGPSRNMLNPIEKKKKKGTRSRHNL